MANAPELWPAQIMLLTSAVPVAIEAYKAKPPGFYILWGITLVMILAGIFTPMIVTEETGRTLYALATNPFTWFVLVVALFFVVRPYWQRQEPSHLVAPANHTTPPPVNHGGPPYDDSELRGAIAAIDSKFASFISARNQRLEQLTAEVEATKKAVAPLSDAFEALKALPHAKHLLKKAPQAPAYPAHAKLEPPMLRPPESLFYRELRSYFPDLQLDTGEALQEQIRNDPIYVVLHEGEAELFGSPEAKRNWHLRKTKNDAVRESMEKLVRQLENRAKPFLIEREK